jgi:hypothetical protein
LRGRARLGQRGTGREQGKAERERHGNPGLQRREFGWAGIHGSIPQILPGFPGAIMGVPDTRNISVQM